MPKSTRHTRRRFARIGSGTSLCLRYRLPQAADRLPGAQLSREAKQRLRWMDYARTHSVSATCRHFGIARSPKLNAHVERSNCSHRNEF